MYTVFNVVMICLLAEMCWFNCLFMELFIYVDNCWTIRCWSYRVSNLESKQLLYSVASIKISSIFFLCALNDIKWHCNNLFHFFFCSFVYWVTSNETQQRGNKGVRVLLRLKKALHWSHINKTDFLKHFSIIQGIDTNQLIFLVIMHEIMCADMHNVTEQILFLVDSEQILYCWLHAPT